MIKKNFQCSAPWEGMFINPTGEFRVCCAGKSLGNLNNESVEEILYGENLTSVRTDILEQGYSDYCTNCMESEEKSGKSLRAGFATDLSVIDTSKFTPKTVDIRWRNTCQLRCGYCNSDWSSAFARWEGKSERASVKDWQQDVLNFLSNDKASIKVVNLLGGEPLLLKENIELLNYVDEDTLIGLVTNLSIEDVESLPVYQKLIERNANWLVSLEAIGNKFEYIRRNAKWKTTKANYENLTLGNQSGKGCHMTYCITSAFSLVETFDWLYEVNPDPSSNHTFISVLLGPGKFSIYNFPTEIKQLAIAELDNLSAKYDHYLNDMTKHFITTTKQSLTDSLDTWDVNIVAEFMDYVKQSDVEMAPISFKEEWPEVHAILERYMGPA